MNATDIRNTYRALPCNDLVAEVKYLGPTNHRGSRWKATIPAYDYRDARPQHVAYTDYALSNAENAYAAVLQLIEKMHAEGFCQINDRCTFDFEIVAEINIGAHGDKFGFLIRQKWHDN